MKRIPTWMIAGLTFVAGALVTLMLTSLLQRQPAPAAPLAGAEPAVLYWYDPMYPDRHFEQPGKSPFMDMQLVPKYADGQANAEGTVQIDPRIAQNLGVRTGVAERGALATQVRASATVAFDEREVSAVQARVNGIVESLAVRSPLTTVRRGQVLMVLTAPEWTAAQEEYLALRRTQTSGLLEVRDAARRRLGLLGMSEAQIRAIESANHAQTRISVVAPRDGVVTELAVREGETVMSGATLARINGVQSVWVHAAIAEAQIALVAPGVTAEVHLSAFPGQTFSGTVETLLPTIDAASRTQTARIVLDNPTQQLTPGMVGEVRITTDGADETVLVPSEAVIVTGTRQVVLVATDGGAFRAQEVRVGAEADGKAEILEGVAAGERVVLSGQFLIDSEASLSGTLSRLGVDKAERMTDGHEGAQRDDTTKEEPEHHQASGEVLAIDDRAADPLVDRQPLPGAAGTVILTAWGVLSLQRTPRRRAAGPLGRAGHHPHHLPWAGAAGRREPGDLSADDDDAVGAGREDGARLLVLRRFSFVYVLFDDGTDLYWARSRVLEYLNQVQARLPRRHRLARTRCHRRRLDLPVRAGRPQRPAWTSPQLRALQDWFLKYELKTCRTWPRSPASAAWCASTRSCSTRTSSRPTASRTHVEVTEAIRGQPGGRRLGAGTGRGRVHGARQRLPAVARRLPRSRCDRRWCVGAPVLRCRPRPARPGDAARHRRARRRGRSATGGVIVMRSGKNALETIAAVKAKLDELQAQPAQGRRDRRDLRPRRA
jgi:Cu(I)/Ag(I) efflux system membrane fusion protein